MMEFSYYYGNQADQFSFIRIPRVLLVDQLFSPLSIQSKILYGVLLDRMGISMRNGWFDELNRVYIIYQISEIQEDLGFSKKKAIDYLTELEQFGLVEKKRRGRGLPSILYVKSFMTRDAISRSVETGTSEPIISISRSAEIDTSRGSQIAPLEVPESTLLEVPKSAPLMSNNNINNTYMSNIPSNQILSTEGTEVQSGCDEDEMRSVRAYAEIISENLELEILKQGHGYDVELLDGIYDLILEVVVSKSPTTIIASNEYPTELVKSKFLKLTSMHVEYVMDCFNQNSTKVRNIKKYLLAALFNAPSTISGYYTAEVHHLLYDNPTKRISGKGGVPKKEKKALTDQQVEQLLDAIRGLPPYVFVMIGLYAGLRREEILALQWDCVFLDGDTPYISVRRAWYAEHNKPVILDELKTKAARREIPIPDCLAECLREAKANSKSDFVVANRDGGPLTYTQFVRVWKYITTRSTKERTYVRYVNGQRIKHTVKPVLGEKAAHNNTVVYSMDFQVTPHQLRHTYITNLIYAAVDPKTVQYLAGHENSKITMDIYAKVKYNRPQELAAVVNSAFNKG